MNRSIRCFWAVAALAVALPAVHADWLGRQDAFPWATPGQTTWLIDYSRMNEAHVKLMLEAKFNLLQGGSFTPGALRLAKSTPGIHTMQYICSRTIYHKLLFKTNPELKDAAILNPDGSYKIIYHNPARYAGCYNRKAWLEYIKGRMDTLQATGIDCIFFDNPMTWACYCPTCRTRFREFAKNKTGHELDVGQFDRPTELEHWFSVETAQRFFEKVHAYAQRKGMFMVVNNLTYWLVNQGVTDGVFTEAWGHPPFGDDIAAYKVGLAASRGKPTGVLSYIPQAVKKARGHMVKNHSRGSGEKPVGAPVAEEFELGYAEGLACAGNYMVNYSLELGRHIPAVTQPEDKRIQAAMVKYGTFVKSHPDVYADPVPGSPIAVLYSLTTGPRTGQILGHRRPDANKLLWALIHTGLPVEVIVEDDLTPERLKGTRAIIVSGVAVLEPEAVAGLERFARAGGTVVFAGAARVRGRYEPADRAKSLSACFPGLPIMDLFEYTSGNLELNGYEVEGERVKASDIGRATATFNGAKGRYRIAVSYLDENDGKGSFDLEIGDRKIQTWNSDADDNLWHVHVSAAVPLNPGAKVTVVGHSEGGEYARIRRIRISTDLGTESGADIRVGEGRVILRDTPLDQLNPTRREQVLSELRPLCPIRTATHPWPAKLLVNLTRSRSGRTVNVHLVNYDFTYDEGYALRTIRPVGPLRIAVPGAKSARLLSPDHNERTLEITDGIVEVPSIKTYSVIIAEW
ncbi:MAG: hypothetical protein KAI66_14580 [Lentisphaeria bacterium]|nr:hypothetical protein [Lentisphaeria bacterium]